MIMIGSPERDFISWEFQATHDFQPSDQNDNADSDETEREKDGFLRARNKRKLSFLPLWRTPYKEKCKHGTSQLVCRVWMKWI